jgi:SpoVK/Ycf46/Vps4 family AAA+-type ATPase
LEGQAKAAIAEAQAAHAQGNGRLAAQKYESALRIFHRAREWEKDPTRLKSLDARIAELTTRHVPVHLSNPAPPTQAPPPPQADAPKGDEAGAPADDEGERWIMRGSPNVRLDDIAGLDDAKRAFMDAMVYMRSHPSLYRNTMSVRGFMLYGPSGTGKTQLVRALATEMKWTMLTVNPSQIFNEWLGKSEKEVDSLFQTARRHKPCIVFIDEADGILGDGGGGGSDRGGGDAARRVRTTFQTQIDGITTNQDERDMIIVIATNYPWMFSDAMRRRFPKHIHIPLPDKEGRAALINILLRGRTHALTPEDVDGVADATERMSGADMKQLASEVFMCPVHRVQAATHFVQRDEHWVPCDPDEPDAVERDWRTLTDTEIACPPITAADWHDCLRRGAARPTNTPEMLARYAAYASEASKKH